MLSDSLLSLDAMELRLRSLLPADLYAAVWLDPVPENLMRVFEHLRTLHRILQDYAPRQVSENPARPGTICYRWQEGTLLFTDLAGFTPLLEAHATGGYQGAMMLLNVINRYFSEMLEIVSKSGGDLLEFTGDAMLVQFLADQNRGDVAQAVRAGLRMQRAMAHFADIETGQGQFSLDMRVGIHTGRFLTADIGTPLRMVHALFGNTVRRAKRAEGAGHVGRVCLTKETGDRLKADFSLSLLEPSDDAYVLVNDTFAAEQLGEYDIAPTRRPATALLVDRSTSALLTEIQETVKRVEVLSSYLPAAILNLLVENAAKRQIPPDFPSSVVIFVNLKGLPEAVDAAASDELDGIVVSFSKAVAMINAAVSSRGGTLQKATYHSVGSDLLIYFGVLGNRTDDTIRAVNTALVIRDIVTQLTPPTVKGDRVDITCRIGLASGAVFAAEIGEPRGRREFNILGDPVNTAARLMTQAAQSQILMTKDVYVQVCDRYSCHALGEITLKGKSHPMPIFALQEAF